MVSRAKTGVLIILCSILVVPTHAIWRPVPLNQKRVIGSMSDAALHLGGIIVHGITAFENVFPGGVRAYKVTFKANFRDVIGIRFCWATVYWHGFVTTVKNAGCIPPFR